MKRFVSIFILVTFIITGQIGTCPVYARDFVLPVPGVMVPLSPEFNPPILKGIKVYPDNPFRFDFILDRGEGQLSNDALKNESSKLIKYFLASLTIPEKDLWVNLSPYEKDRIVPNSFGRTEMGRDLLAEDYMLKQITASLIYPEGEIGKRFWKRIYEQAAKRYGTTNIPVNTFNKVWIMPEKAVVYENAKAGTAYVVASKLKVMLEQDYLSLKKHEGVFSARKEVKDNNQLGRQVVREIVIPELTKEVNSGKNFSQLRQVYNSLILATWYKKKIKDSILLHVYENKNKIAGVNTDDPQEKKKIYERYLQAFKKGVFNYIKEEEIPALPNKEQEILPRKYFSGGVNYAMFGDKTDSAMSIKEFGPNDNFPEGMGDDPGNEDILKITISAVDTHMALEVLKQILSGVTPEIDNEIEMMSVNSKVEELRESFPRLISMIARKKLKVNDSLINQLESVYGISQTGPVSVYERLIDEQIYRFFYYGIAEKDTLQAEALSKEYINDCIILMLPDTTPFINPFGPQNGKQVNRQEMLAILKDGFNSIIKNEKRIIEKNRKMEETEQRKKREQDILKNRQEQREQRRQRLSSTVGQTAAPNGTDKKKERREEIRSVFIPNEERLAIMAVNAKTKMDFIENVRKINGNKDFLPGVVAAELVKDAQLKGWQTLDEYFMSLKEGKKNGPKDGTVSILEKPSLGIGPPNVGISGYEKENLGKKLTIPITSSYLNIKNQGFEISMMPQSVWMNKDILLDKKTGSLMKEIIDWVSNNSEIIFRNKGEYKQWAPGIYRFVFMPKGHGKQQVYVRLLPGEKKIIFAGFMPRPTAHINDHNSLKIELKRYLIDLSGIKTYEDFKKKGVVDIFEPNKAMAVPLYNKTIDFAMSNQWSKESIQARKLEAEKIRAGFSYDETKNYYYLWRKAPLDSKPKVPNGFWKSEKTAINYLLAVLDENLSQDPNGPKIAGNKSAFKNAREAGDIKKMAELYRFYVIEKGQNNFFDKQGGMAGLIRNFSPFLDKRGPGALLRLASKPGGALEGLVDANNKDALKPWEIEEDYWNEQTAAAAVVNALKWYVPGFELAMNEENAKARIKEMARLYRKTVMEYPGTTQKYLGGQVRFFYEVAQLSGLIEHSRPFLDKKLSAAALLRLATKHDEKLNGLVDANNKDALKPWEIEENYWNKTRAAAAVVNALKWYVPGFELAMNEKDTKVRIKEMARLYLKYVKNSKADPELDPPQTRNGQQGFYYRAQLANLMKDQSFLNKTASGGALLRLAVELTPQLKGMIDDNNPEALHLQDIEYKDSAMSYGGIDLTPSNMNLQTQNAGEGIKFHMNPAMLARLQNAPGFVPVIINIQPLTDLRIFLGLENQKT